MRGDELALRLDADRAAAQAMPVDPRPAAMLRLLGVPGMSGGAVYDVFGYLLHWTVASRLAAMWESGVIGSGAGVWLTPTAYASCMTPYDLGLDTARDAVLLIDPRRIPALWGPGSAGPSLGWPAIWRGGAVEFYSPSPLDAGVIVDVLGAEPCGDTHR